MNMDIDNKKNVFNCFYLTSSYDTNNVSPTLFKNVTLLSFLFFFLPAAPPYTTILESPKDDKPAANANGTVNPSVGKVKISKTHACASSSSTQQQPTGQTNNGVSDYFGRLKVLFRVLVRNSTVFMAWSTLDTIQQCAHSRDIYIWFGGYNKNNNGREKEV